MTVAGMPLPVAADIVVDLAADLWRVPARAIRSTRIDQGGDGEARSRLRAAREASALALAEATGAAHRDIGRQLGRRSQDWVRKAIERCVADMRHDGEHEAMALALVAGLAATGEMRLRLAVAQVDAVACARDMLAGGNPRRDLARASIVQLLAMVDRLVDLADVADLIRTLFATRDAARAAATESDGRDLAATADSLERAVRDALGIAAEDHPQTRT